MKGPFKIVFLSLAAAASLIGCNKQSGKSSASKPALAISKSTVERGEQLTVSVKDLPVSAAIKWSIFPSPGTRVLPGRNEATAFFGNPGTYTLTANFYADSSAPTPYDSSALPIHVSDSIYTPPAPVTADTSSLVGDQIAIEPIFATDSAGVYMLVQTRNVYDCWPGLLYSFTVYGNTMTLNCMEVTSTIPLVDCGGVRNTAQAFLSTAIGGVRTPNGVYTFNVILNNIVYAGTLTITDQNYTFGWSYSSGVTISPLQINKQ
jgi:hypothetical protein